jgi:hypothetical protein
LIVDHGVEQVLRADRPEWVPVFTGLSVRQFQELVGIVAGRSGAQSGAGRRWGLSMADRVLLTTVYYRANLTFRQIALLFGISKSAANRWLTDEEFAVLPAELLAASTARKDREPGRRRRLISVVIMPGDVNENQDLYQAIAPAAASTVSTTSTMVAVRFFFCHVL